jgi:hypothetical protein
MFTPTGVEARNGYRIWLRYADGTEGEVDLSHLAGRGVFARWTDDPAAFRAVHVADDEAIRWTDAVELCPDALYLRLTGETVEEGGVVERLLVVRTVQTGLAQKEAGVVHDEVAAALKPPPAKRTGRD